MMRIYVISLLCFLAINSLGQVPIENELVNIIVSENNNGRFSGSVVITKGKQILAAKSVGFANKEKKLLNDSTTKFVIASTGKLLTHVLILQLRMEGKLSLSDTIGKYFSGFDKKNANKITIADLLNHRSGLGDVFNSKEYSKDRNFQDVQKVVALIAKEKPSFVPGTEFKYSNSGYFLLGAIAEKIENRPLNQLMQERIFRPLGMQDSGFANAGDYVINRALPYKGKGSNASVQKVALVGDPPSGAGGQYSSVGDLHKFCQSILFDNKLLDDDSKGLLFNHDLPTSWEEIKRSGKIFGFVGGDTGGWSAKITFMFTPSSIYCVVIVANFDNMAHELDLKLREVLKRDYK